jgi:hypothetical protein
MEVGVLGDHAAILIEMAASRADDDIEIVDCVEVFVGKRFVDERPEVLGWLQFRAVGWLVDEPDARRERRGFPGRANRRCRVEAQ